MVAQIELGAIAAPIILQTLDDYVEIEKRLNDELARLRYEHAKLAASKKYTAKIKQQMANLEYKISDRKKKLAQLQIMKSFSPGQWVRNGTSKPGQIEALQVVGIVPQVQVKWWLSTASVPESADKLTLVPEEDLNYIWDGQDYPKLIRKCDRFECEDLQVLNQELTKLSDDQTREAAYLKKRIQLFGGNCSDKLSIISKCFSKPEIKTIAIADIQRDELTQQRVKLNPETVTEYAEAMRYGDKFPPIKVKYDGEKYWLFDGFHTTEAAWSIGLTEISAEITQGSQREAILESVSVNASHGLRRSNADKRKAVTTLLNDEEWGKWSDREIGRQCRVHHSTVAKIRKELSGYLASDNLKSDNLIITGNVSSDNQKTYKDKHGNVSVMNCENIGKTQSQQDIETPETDKLNDRVTKQSHNESVNKPEFKINQLVQLKLSSFEGVSEKVKSLNHSYGLVRGMTETKTGYNVLVFGRQSPMTSSYTVKAEDLKPIESVSFCTEFSADEFIKLMLKHHSRDGLEEAIRKGVLHGIE